MPCAVAKENRLFSEQEHQQYGGITLQVPYQRLCPFGHSAASLPVDWGKVYGNEFNLLIDYLETRKGQLEGIETPSLWLAVIIPHSMAQIPLSWASHHHFFQSLVKGSFSGPLPFPPSCQVPLIKGQMGGGGSLSTTSSSVSAAQADGSAHVFGELKKAPPSHPLHPEPGEQGGYYPDGRWLPHPPSRIKAPADLQHWGLGSGYEHSIHGPVETFFIFGVSLCQTRDLWKVIVIDTGSWSCSTTYILKYNKNFLTFFLKKIQCLSLGSS